jgi:hypothetical protein
MANIAAAHPDVALNVDFFDAHPSALRNQSPAKG